MEQEIEKLLQNLDSRTVESLPCFYDGPELIQFRIGLQEGPQILFNIFRNDDYNLFFRDDKKRKIGYKIKVGDENFNKCEKICQRIKVLCENDGYKENRNKNIEIMIHNLINLVKPVLDKSGIQEKNKKE